MDRRLFITTGAVGAAGMVLPSVADAHKRMGPKFNPELRVRRDGLVVVARGPIGKKLTGPTYYAAVIMQGHRIGHGISEQYGPGDDVWDAIVHADHSGFRPGRAMAHGVAVSPESDEVYTYAWSMSVELAYLKT